MSSLLRLRAGDPTARLRSRNGKKGARQRRTPLNVQEGLPEIGRIAVAVAMPESIEDCIFVLLGSLLSLDGFHLFAMGFFAASFLECFSDFSEGGSFWVWVAHTPKAPTLAGTGRFGAGRV